MPSKNWRQPIHFSRQTRDWVEYPFGHPLHGTPPPEWSDSNTIDVNLGCSVLTGTSPADWKTRIRNGFNATSSLSADISEGKAGSNPGFISAERTQLTGAGRGQIRITQMRGDLCSYTNISPSDPTHEIESVKNEVKLKIVDQIRSACTSLQGMVALGEMGETLRLINGTAKAIDARTRSYLQAVINHSRSSRRHSLGRKLDWIAKRWLEYSFGVKPLISDVKDAAKALARLQNYRSPRVNVRYSAGSAYGVGAPITVNRSSGLINLKIQVRQTNEFNYRIYGVVGIQPHSPTQYARNPILDEMGFRLDEFFPTMWELIPYSFLVDYFTNIGGMINAASLNTSTVRWLASGQESISKVTASVLECEQVPAGTGQKNSGFTRDLGDSFERSRRKLVRSSFNPDFLVPSFQFGIPGTSTKWLNIAALAFLHRKARLSLRE